MWRIRLDSSTGYLALEVRDADLLLTQFFTLDTDGYTLQQLDLPQAQAWWQGLEDAEHGQLYLHGYGKGQLGQHKGITAIAEVSRQKIWETSELSFYGAVKAGLVAYDPKSPEAPLQVLNPQNGQPTGRHLSQQQAAEEVALFNLTRYRECIYPVLYREGEGHFEEVKAFLQDQLGAEPVQGIEYAETNANLLISFYTEEAGGKLGNYLAIFDLEGYLHQKVQLGNGLSGIGTDTFFIFKHNLHFIQNKDIFQVIRLLA